MAQLQAPTLPRNELQPASPQPPYAGEAPVKPCAALGFSRRLPHGTRLSAGCGRNWMNLCGARK
jgi:hypothetical protein